MSRAETLIAAIAKNATYVANLDAAAKKKPLTAKQKASRASAVEKFDAYVAEYAGLVGGGTSAPAPDPYPGKSMFERATAWDHDQAQREVDKVLADLGTADLDAQLAAIAAVSPALLAKALCLGDLAGPPGSRAGVDYDLALPYGGYWGVSSGDVGASEAGPGEGSDVNVAWNAGKAVRTYRNRGADPVLNNLEVARANGIDIAHVDRPASDYKGEFNAPVNF